jgi:hypothetical protein
VSIHANKAAKVLESLGADEREELALQHVERLVDMLLPKQSSPCLLGGFMRHCAFPSDSDD